MRTSWRISSFHGALVLCYLIPSWTILAWRIAQAPIVGMFERSNSAVVLFFSDYLGWGMQAVVRIGWLLALGRITTVIFALIFLISLIRERVTGKGDWAEPLRFAVALGALISFACMLMAATVGQVGVLRVHAAELLLLLGTAVLLALEQPQAAPSPSIQHQADFSQAAT